MEFEIVGTAGKAVAILKSDGIVITKTQDALDLMGNADYQGARQVIIREEHLPEHFFDLKTGFAGEILGKFAQYQIRIAVVGDFSQYTGKALKDFIYESNKVGTVLFLPTQEEALARLSSL